MRKYFEEGCLCNLTGLIEKQDIPDEEAVEYYMNHCTCSRNPESHLGVAWDKWEYWRTWE